MTGISFLSIEIRQISKPLLYAALLIIVSGLTALNAGKVPESDMLTYLDIVRSASDRDFANFISGYYREYLYYTVVWVLAQFEILSPRLVLLTISFTAYWLFGAAIIRYGEKTAVNNNSVLAVLTGSLFLPMLFSLSMHISRQYLAAAIFVYLMSMVSNTSKKWPAMAAVFSSFTHISALAFVLIMAVSGLRKLRGFLLLATITAFFLGIYIIRSAALQILSFMGDTNWASLVVLRLISAENVWDVQPLSTPSLVFLVLSIILSIRATNQKHLRNVIHLEPYSAAFIVAICCSLTGVLIPPLAEISLRFLFYLYFIFPFVLLPLIAQKRKIIRLDLIFLLAGGLLMSQYIISPSWTYSWSVS